MKRFLLAFFILAIAATASADSGRMHNPEPITGTLAASGTTTTDPINLASLQPSGFFSMQVLVTGSGTLKIEYEVSNVNSATGGKPSDSQFVTPSGASDIVTSHTAASGVSGLDFYQFPSTGEPIFAKWIRFKLTETSTTDTVTYTLYPNIQ